MAAELRHHPRFNSQFSACLHAADGHQYDCTVLDYSHSGMRLSWPHSLQPPLGSLHTLALQLEDGTVQLDVEWVFQRGKEVGLKVQNPDDRVFLQLQESNQQHRASGGLTPEQRQQHRQRVSRDATEFADRLVKRWLPDYLEALFEQANVARSTVEQQDWLRLEKYVKQRASTFCDQFKQRLQQQLQRWLDGKPRLIRAGHNDSQDGDWQLSLVQQTEFEDWLLAKVTASHLQSRLSQQNFQVRQILDALSTASSVDDCFNPIGANTLTEAFVDALEALRLPAAARTLAFELFEQLAAQLMQHTYEQLCRDIHIPMTFHYRKPRPAEVAVSQAEQRRPANADRTAEAANATPHSPEQAPNQGSQHLHSFQQHQLQARQAYANIQSLLQLRQQHQNHATPTMEPATTQQPVAAPQAVEAALHQVAQQSRLGSGNILAQVEQQLAQQQTALSAGSRDAIDTLQSVTQQLLQSGQIADFVKPHIEAVGWPVLRLMLDDASLLFNPQHPGRQVLNQLARLGQLTTSGQQQLGQRIEALVAELKTQDVHDAHAFERLLEQLEELVSQAERKAKQNTERVAQAAEGEHKLQQSRRHIEQLLGKDMAGRTLPHCVVEWLQQGWQSLLSLLLLREGQDSKRFQGAVKLYRQVLVLFSRQNAGRQELLERFRPMMDLARYELDQMNGPQPHHQQWQHEILQAAEEHLAQGQMRSAVDLPDFVVSEDEPAPAGRGLRKARNLQVGDWLLLTESDQAISLAWVASDASKFACVNHSGMKVIDFTLAELARAFDNGQVKRLYEKQESAVDQSIDKLVEQIYRELSDQANQDDLTGLINRAHFVRVLETRFEQAVRTSQPLLLCLLDVDGFRDINRRYGLTGGDICLQALATTLEDRYPDALIARSGSNEFALLQAPGDDVDVPQQLQQLQQRLQQLDMRVAEQSFHVQVSLGATMLSEQEDAAELLEQAQNACSSAKEKGGAALVWYQAGQDHPQHDPLHKWYQQVMHAEPQRRSLLALPVERLQEHGDDIHHFMLLTGLSNSHGLQHPPAESLHSDYANRCPLALEQWQLQQVLAWLDSNRSDAIRLVVPCSGELLLHSNTYSLLRQACDDMLPVQQLCFELSDTDRLDDLAEAAEQMHQLRKLGYRFGLGDFGTGQSAFVALKQLPVDYVRLDYRFIDQLSSSAADYALVKSMQDIARFMAKRTLAEYSANQTSRDILVSLGVDYAIQAPEQAVLLTSL
ncbi:hypothetical protein GCM10011297_26050 [Bacterioplanes sanyensis]|uniref:DUF1631 family protein n=1 Tax=Bacterioplanes sanyensis TaxID=1249553 RepID=UPI0016732CEC|nr:DUF1631 family protein [Bacterioplanes sanyensis]GGY52026.1 hypothetical protein GCM10011297_26050 [Bacterioplanes sanyensis]